MGDIGEGTDIIKKGTRGTLVLLDPDTGNALIQFDGIEKPRLIKKSAGVVLRVVHETDEEKTKKEACEKIANEVGVLASTARKVDDLVEKFTQCKFECDGSK